MQAALPRPHVYSPNAGGQRAFIEDWKHRRVSLEGGWGSGKTFAGALKLVTLHLFNAMVPLGNGQLGATFVPSAVIGLDYRNLKTTNVPQIESILDGLNIRHRVRLSDAEIVLTDLGTVNTPSVIYLRSADEPARITGWQVGTIWLDESARFKEDRHNPKNDPILQARGRLRHRRAHFRQEFHTSTHEGDHTRFYETFHSGDPTAASYRADTRENLNHIGKDYVDDLLRLPPEHVKQYVEGRAVSLRGAAVYSLFAEANNVVKAASVVDVLPLSVYFDFNIAPGMHVCVGQYSPQEDMFNVVRVVHGPRMDLPTSVDHVIDWVESTGGWRWPEILVYGDSAGHSESARKAGESSYDLIVKKLRLAISKSDRKPPVVVCVPRAHPPVSDRILATNMALMDVDGKSHVRIHPSCTQLLNDFRKLRYDDRGRLDRVPQELKHASDAFGYGVHYVRPVQALFVQETDDFGRFNV